MKSVAKSYRLGFAAIQAIVAETCRAIWDTLGPDDFLALPTPKQWRQHALDFERDWQFPNCVGAVDRKHVQMEKPINSDSIKYNYKVYCNTLVKLAADLYKSTD